MCDNQGLSGRASTSGFGAPLYQNTKTAFTKQRAYYISNLLMNVACTGAFLDVNTQAKSPSLTSNLKGEDHSVLIVQI